MTDGATILVVEELVTLAAVAEQRYRSLLDGANDAIAVLGPDGLIREVNQRWVEMTGHPREQLVGHHPGDFAPSGKQDESILIFNQTVKSGRTPPIEFATPGGSSVLLEFTSATVDVSGEQLVLTIGRDVTGRSRLEDRSRQAQKLEAVAQLAGGVAHAFNNVLTAILGFSELMMSGLSSDDPIRADVLEVQKAGERAVSLTRQLLAFSRKYALQPKVIDISAIIAGMKSKVEGLIPECVISTLSLATTACVTRMDQTQFEQIVVNLVTNAADAMPRGGQLTIETGNVTLDDRCHERHLSVAPGAYVMLTVRDTGVGMDEAISRRIFEPFFTTKGAGKGTGLGLAMVLGIVGQSQGDVAVHSEPGRGSTFRIYLPQVASPTPEM
jgi:two-component system, cell cycle sensor histidine kinase and response regulator CckA